MDGDVLILMNSKFEDFEKLFNKQNELIMKQVDKTETNVERIREKIDTLVNAEKNHYAECPLRIKIESMEKRNSELYFIVKYYKVFLLALVSVLGGMFWYQGNTASNQNTTKTEVKANSGKISKIITDEVNNMLGN